jgi:hypothetical protein
MRRLLLLLTLLLALPAQASAADLHATPSTFASTFASAQGGDNVLLASGAYGSFDGGKKSSVVTVKPEAGATVTMAGATFNASSNITVQGVSFGISQVVVSNGSTGITFVDDTWGAYNAGGSYEGRLSVVQGADVTVKNSHFGPGGCSDGIQVSGGGGAAGVVTVDNTEFEGIMQGSCGPHADPIQLYGGVLTLTDSYFHGNSTGIMSPDCNGAMPLVKNNVFISTGYHQSVIAGSDATIVHNVTVGWYLGADPGRCSGAVRNTTLRDNAGDTRLTGGDSNSHIDYNGTVSFVGGAGRCAYATAAPKGTASDGTDIGLNDCGSTPFPPLPPSSPPPTDQSPLPPPPAAVQCNDGIDNDRDGLTDFPADPGCSSATDTTESTNPTADHQPSARFTVAPASPVIGQPVTFDATSSTCDDTPCAYTLVDDGFDGSGGVQWPLGNGPTLSFTFRGVGTKNVRVTLTDADGDTDTTVKAISVTAPPPSDNGPDTEITSGPDGATSDPTPTFAFTSSESDPAFECRVDSGAWTDCASPWTTVALPGGDHCVSVRATDVAGKTDASPATRWLHR